MHGYFIVSDREAPKANEGFITVYRYNVIGGKPMVSSFLAKVYTEAEWQVQKKSIMEYFNITT